MLELRELRLRRGAAVLFDRANLTIFRGDKIGIVGRQRLRQVQPAGLLRATSAPTRRLRGARQAQLRLGVAGAAQDGCHGARICARRRRAADGDRGRARKGPRRRRRHAGSHLLGDYDLAGGYTSAARAAEVASGLGISPEDVERPVKVLSGGLQMRANMARALMSRADVLMLDEPTNHLDLDAVLWLEGWLQRFPGTLLLVSHDREFLDDIVGRIVNIENGKLTHWTGNYTDFQRQHAASIQQSAAMAARQEREVARLHSSLTVSAPRPARRARYRAASRRSPSSRPSPPTRSWRTSSGSLPRRTNYPSRWSRSTRPRPATASASWCRE
jgi:ATP-binding cassette subfamily F protein 3